jgi:hypothetical protein
MASPRRLTRHLGRRDGGQIEPGSCEHIALGPPSLWNPVEAIDSRPRDTSSTASTGIASLNGASCFWSFLTWRVWPRSGILSVLSKVGGGHIQPGPREQLYPGPPPYRLRGVGFAARAQVGWPFGNASVPLAAPPVRAAFELKRAARVLWLLRAVMSWPPAAAYAASLRLEAAGNIRAGLSATSTSARRQAFHRSRSSFFSIYRRARLSMWPSDMYS